MLRPGNNIKRQSHPSGWLCLL